MAEKKHFYAVKNGRKTGIFKSWDECKRQVIGFKGAVYKGFVTEQEAIDYMEGNEADHRLIKVADDKHLTAYVDGSFSKAKKQYSFGCVFISPDGSVEKMNGSYSDADGVEIRNVAGEMQGALHAAHYAIDNGFEAVDIYYDYAGVEMWATGQWKTNKVLTKKYAEEMQRLNKSICITFHKVAAHTGVEYNEMADQLAKSAIGI